MVYPLNTIKKTTILLYYDWYFNIVICMEIKVLYPKRNEERNYLNDWDIKVSYKEQIPTKADIEKDYKELPISKKYWSSWQLDIADPKYKESILEEIFKLFNSYKTNPMSINEMQDWIKENKVSHTSMSVGDIVILDNDIYVCANEGWKKVIN